MITTIELKKLQKLARLEFTEAEMNAFTGKLNNIIKMIGAIKEVDCAGIEPLRSVSDAHQRLRTDEVSSGDISDQIFSNIPNKEAEIAREIKCFIVPKVVE